MVEDVLKTVSDSFYSCGKNGVPQQVTCLQTTYELEQIFKHDFFAATALYIAAVDTGSNPKKIILKINRESSFLHIPLKWLGRFLTKREVGIVTRLKDIPNTPRFLEYYSDTGFMYEYIAGTSLDHYPELPDTFFDDLLELIKEVHDRNIAYLDMNKRGNILIGDDQQPHLIDFQISHHIGDLPLGLSFISDFLRNGLQQEDIFHICKHKRRFQPELLTPEQRAIAENESFSIKAHRIIVWPYKKVRRAMLRMLYHKKILTQDESIKYSRENDATKYAK